MSGPVKYLSRKERAGVWAEFWRPESFRATGANSLPLRKRRMPQRPDRTLPMMPRRLTELVQDHPFCAVLAAR